MPPKCTKCGHYHTGSQGCERVVRDTAISIYDPATIDAQIEAAIDRERISLYVLLDNAEPPENIEEHMEDFDVDDYKKHVRVSLDNHDKASADLATLRRARELMGEWYEHLR